MTQGDLAALLPFALIALVFWFLIFRPARKRQRETMQTQSSLEVGVRVMLTSGIFGDVVSVGDAEVEVEVAPGTVVTVHRQAIGKVVPPEDPAVPADSDAADDTDDEDAETTEPAADRVEREAETTDEPADTDTTDERDDAGATLPPTHQEK